MAQGLLIFFFLFSLKSKEDFFPFQNACYSGNVILNVLFLYGSFFHLEIPLDVVNSEIPSYQWLILPKLNPPPLLAGIALPLSFLESYSCMLLHEEEREMSSRISFKGRNHVFD